MSNRRNNNNAKISTPGIIVVAGIAIAVTMFLIVHLSNRTPSAEVSAPEPTPEPVVMTFDVPEPVPPEPEPPEPEPEEERRYDHHGIWLQMPIFYHPDGAAFYHVEQDCSSVEDRFLPLSGETTFEGLDQAKYRQLQPCISCQAPARPHAH